MSSPIASKHSVFSITEVSASEVPATDEEICLERRPKLNFRGRHFETSWQPGRAYMTSFRPTRNWRKEKTLQLTLHPSRSAKCIFSQTIVHFTIFTAIFYGVRSMFGIKTLRLKSSHIQSDS